VDPPSYPDPVALPRRGTHPVRIDGQTLRWAYVLRNHPTGDHALVVCARGARLVVFLPWRRPTGWISGHQAHRPLPQAWVVDCIRAALRHGWTPTAPGPEVHLTLADILPDAPLPPVPRAD
jgi:hypothetical protein